MGIFSRPQDTHIDNVEPSIQPLFVRGRATVLNNDVSFDRWEADETDEMASLTAYKCRSCP